VDRFISPLGHWRKQSGSCTNLHPLSLASQQSGLRELYYFWPIPRELNSLWYQKGLLAGVAQMRIVKSMFPIAVSLGLVAAVTAILWQVNLRTSGSHGLVYFYLFPVALIAALYSGRLAVLCTAIALVCADYFLQEPLYSLANDNPLEYGDLIWFAVLAAAGIKFIRVLVRPRAKILEARSSQADI
jgi:K+-sensing histidine kinase KdpD